MRGIWIICKARKYLNQSTLISLYYAFIYPYLNYCVEVWGNTYTSYTDPILRLQKRVLRIITGSAKFSHTVVLFSELQILKLEQITTVPCRCSCTDIIITCYRIYFVIFSNPILRFTRTTHDNIAITMYPCVA